MKTKTIKAIIYIQTGVLFLMTFFLYSYAQEQSPSPKYGENSVQRENVDPQYCSQYNVCSGPSLEMQSYLDFMNEMIGVLNQTEKKQVEGMKYPIAGLFQKQYLKISAGVLDTARLILKNTIIEQGGGIRAISISTIIFASMGKELLLKDVRGGISMIFRKKPFVREWVSLENLDGVIYDLTYNIAIKGYRYDDIDETTAKKVDYVLKKYTSQEIGSNLFESAAINPGTQYSNLVTMLMRLNTTMKGFVATPWISVGRFQNQLFNDNNEFVRRTIGKTDGFVLRFDMDFLQEMDRKYTCAKSEGVCDETVKKALKNIFDLSEIKSGAQDSWRIMEDAGVRLWESIAGNEDKKAQREAKDKSSNAHILTVEEEKLLRTIYGIDTTKITEGEAIGLRDIIRPNSWKSTFSKSKLVASVKDTFNKVKDEVTDITDPMISELKYANKMKKVAKEVNKNADTLGIKIDKTLLLYSDKNTLIEKMKNEYDILIAKHMAGIEDVAFTENRHITRYFFEIGKQIHGIIESTIQETLAEVGQVCENACTNKGNENCYAK